MATTVTERFAKRRLSGDAGEMGYTVTGTADEATALADMLTAAPATMDGIARDDDASNVEEIGDQVWFGTVVYRDERGTSGDNLSDVGDSIYNFDTSGGIAHVSVAEVHIGDTRRTTGANPPASAKNHYGMIGVTKDGVEGVDIVVPKGAFSETHVVDDADVDQAYRNDLENLTGTVNDATFKGHASGEVLFLGARGTKRGNGDWEITYLFATSENRTSLSVGKSPYDVTVPSKKGWEYMWVEYDEVELNDMMVKVPSHAHVEQVYLYGDFSVLGI